MTHTDSATESDHRGSRGGAATVAAIAGLVGALVASWPTTLSSPWDIAAAPAQTGGYAVDAVWPVSDGDPLAIDVEPDGTSYLVVAPIGPPPADFPTLIQRDATGAVGWKRVVRDPTGTELRPIAVAAAGGGSLAVATDRALVLLSAGGDRVWTAQAGDGHPDFGPAARGLALSGDTLFGADMANARVVGYRVANGQRRLRLGTAGTGAGSFLAPADVAAGADGRLRVADFGNRRVQVLDLLGNPVARWPVPGRPRAVAVDAAGRTLAVLDTEEVIVLGPTGTPLVRFGGAGRAAGRLQMAGDIASAADGRVFVVDRGNRRIQVFRPQDAPATAAPDPTPAATSTAAAPERRSARACSGEPADVVWDVALAPAPPRADVVLVVDTTGSMESLISMAQARAGDIAAALRAVSPDVAIGVVDVRDYPYGPAGIASDWPWLRRAALSTDPAELAAATADLWPGGGGDAPEAYAGGIAAALDDPGMGWRPGARRFVVLLGDSVPRDDDLNAGVGRPHVPGAWTTGAPAWWKDSGPDWSPGSGDDIDWQVLLDRLRTQDVTLLAGISGAAPQELRGITGRLVDYWQAWAERAGPGGQAADLTDVGRLTGSLAGMVGTAGRRIARLSAVAEPPYAAWAAVAPAAHSDVDVGVTGARRRFDIRLQPPPGTPDGLYVVAIDAIGDGGRYARLEVELAWRNVCVPPGTATDGPTPTDTSTPPLPSTIEPSATATPRSTSTPSASPTSTPMPIVHLPLAMRGFCFPEQRPQADIVLVLDTSASMAGPKLNAARAAALAFLDVVNLPRDRTAVVAFDAEARLAAGLTGSRAALRSALEVLDTGEGTRIDRGLAAARTELLGPRGWRDARRVAVLLTDGRPAAGTVGDVVRAADALRAAGATLFTIGLGADVDGDLLIALAGDRSRYTFAPDTTELEAIYRRLAGDIPCR